MFRIIFTFCLLCISLSIPAQRIASIELNNYRFLSSNNNTRYNYYVRELFEKNDTEWVSIENSYDVEGKKGNQYIPTYYSFGKGKPNRVDIYRSPTDINGNSQFTANLLRLRRNPTFHLNSLDSSILEGFEYNDVVATRIVISVSKGTPQIELESSVLDSVEKKIILDSLQKALLKCEFLIPPANSSNWYEKKIIDNVSLRINDTTILGYINIPFNNTCFSFKGASYGGGKLAFVYIRNHSVKFLKANISLIDHFDYDNNGQEEYIFFMSNFNTYGYLMYYNNFKDLQFNGWSYH